MTLKSISAYFKRAGAWKKGTVRSAFVKKKELPEKTKSTMSCISNELVSVIRLHGIRLLQLEMKCNTKKSKSFDRVDRIFVHFVGNFLKI